MRDLPLITQVLSTEFAAAQGGQVRPQSARGANGYLVIIFMSLNCPYARRYYPILPRIVANFPQFG